ncbi:MAG: hypothetical protein K2H38_05645 [Muribaculaceae bacterium]|nr:hypothetical protein [Muribaculaceae bacterium]
MCVEKSVQSLVFIVGYLLRFYSRQYHHGGVGMLFHQGVGLGEKRIDAVAAAAEQGYDEEADQKGRT